MSPLLRTEAARSLQVGAVLTVPVSVGAYFLTNAHIWAPSDAINAFGLFVIWPFYLVDIVLSPHIGAPGIVLALVAQYLWVAALVLAARLTAKHFLRKNAKDL